MKNANLTDIEIARAATMKPITEVAAGLGIPAQELHQYGAHKAKVSPEAQPCSSSSPSQNEYTSSGVGIVMLGGYRGGRGLRIARPADSER